MSLPLRSPILAPLSVAFVSAALAACSGPNDPDMASYTTTELAENVLLVSGPDGNVVVGIQPDGLVVIDGGRAEHADTLLRVLERDAGTDNVATLIDTSWLPDRVGLNEILGYRGTEIVAHINAKQWLEYGADDRAGGGRYEAIPESGWPTRLIRDEGGEVAFGDGVIQLGFLLQANTDADLYAYFPEANVLVTGGAIRSDAWPLIDWGAGGYLGGLDDAGKTLLAVANDETIVVPGSGPVMTRADLQAQADMYSTLFMRVAELVLSAQSPAEAVAAQPLGDFHPDWPNADPFVDRAHRSYRTHIRRDPRLPAIP